MLILIDDLDQCVTTKAATPWEWFVSRVRATRLDRDIAAGVSPDSSPVLALRAQALVQPSMRRLLAGRVRQVLTEATGDDALRFLDPRIPVQRDRVVDATDALRSLIERLLLPGPVPARGVAVARLVLTDGAGPLYNPSCPDDLRARVQAAVEQLEPLSNW
jgi:hypothetical protein